ncbi:MAG: TRAP transporter substrate-binding protein [Rhodospirillaceae bacterium]|jgi:C4-dicarboxylate-binding protein DctP|nr:TRAP transporter substrate-binding protein [Rhodospirillaceae bacterium]MBT5457844.1 TRAP transporter substrate-binding protein [Rhodospirillaceae bacterium]
MKMLPVLAASLLVGFSFAGTSGTALAQTEIKVPMETPPGHIKTRSAIAFKNTLEKISGGKYKVSLFPSAQLMMGKDEVPAVARGQVQMAIPTIGYVSTLDPAFKLLEVPMLFNSYGEMEDVLNGPVGKELLGRLKKKRVMGGGFWYDGFVALWSQTPIRTLEDLKDRKIRVFPSEVLASSTKALGAAPTAIPGPEVFLALKQGVADGAWTTPPYGNRIKLYEVLKSVTKVNLFPFGYVVVVNPAWYKKQGAAGQKMIQTALAAGKAYNLREITNSIDEAYKNVAANGMQVVGFSKKERARWVKALKPLYDGLDPEVKRMLKRIKK